jgi:hypothetical protein
MRSLNYEILDLFTVMCCVLHLETASNSLSGDHQIAATIEQQISTAAALAERGITTIASNTPQQERNRGRSGTSAKSGNANVRVGQDDNGAQNSNEGLLSSFYKLSTTVGSAALSWLGGGASSSSSSSSSSSDSSSSDGLTKQLLDMYLSLATGKNQEVLVTPTAVNQLSFTPLEYLESDKLSQLNMTTACR